MSDDPLSTHMAGLAALRVLLTQALRATDESLELCTLGPDVKGKRRKALLSEIDDLLGVSEQTLAVVVADWQDMPLAAIWADFDKDDEDDDQGEDEDDEDDED